MRVRVEIVPAHPTEADGLAENLDQVEEEAVDVVTAEQTISIDGMEETLLNASYTVMRQALSEHFGKVSKRGLSSTPPPESRYSWSPQVD